jgi:phage baseplate assembly protein W
MAVKDTSKKPYIIDRDSNVKVGIDLPIRRGDEKDGWMASTSTTIDAVKNNIRNLLKTNQGERLMQPNLGTNLRRLLFEQIEGETLVSVQNQILDTMEIWLPFVEVRDIRIVNDDSRTDANQIVVNILFNIKQDPNTVDSVSIDFNSAIEDSTEIQGGGGY